MAAGFTVSMDKFDALKAFFREHGGARMASRPHLLIDAAMAPLGATLEIARALEQLGPYGAGHREPLLALLGCRVFDVRAVGKDQDHVSCLIGAHGGGGGGIKAVAFRSVGQPLGQALLQAQGKQFHLAARLEIDSWNGREQPQLKIVDGHVV
jgi:single-stranded-DNA-specific exonuclease